MAELSLALSPPSLRLRRTLLALHPHPSGRGILPKEGNLILRGTSIRWGMRFLLQTQVLKDLSNGVPLVNEANDSHFSRAFGADVASAKETVAITPDRDHLAPSRDDFQTAGRLAERASPVAGLRSDQHARLPNRRPLCFGRLCAAARIAVKECCCR